MAAMPPGALPTADQTNEAGDESRVDGDADAEVETDPAESAAADGMDVDSGA